MAAQGTMPSVSAILRQRPDRLWSAVRAVACASPPSAHEKHAQGCALLGRVSGPAHRTNRLLFSFSLSPSLCLSSRPRASPHHTQPETHPTLASLMGPSFSIVKCMKLRGGGGRGGGEGGGGEGQGAGRAAKRRERRGCEQEPRRRAATHDRQGKHWQSPIPTALDHTLIAPSLSRLLSLSLPPSSQPALSPPPAPHARASSKTRGDASLFEYRKKAERTPHMGAWPLLWRTPDAAEAVKLSRKHPGRERD